MKLYPRLALSGITKNRKLYLPYMLACIGMTMMFYIVKFLSVDSSVSAIRGGDQLQTILSLGVYVIAVFSVILLFYTHSFLIRRRNKEFGLYNILGMNKKNIARIMLWENAIIAAVSIVLGLICGFVFSKLACLIMARMLGETPSVTLSLNISVVTSTVLLFAAIFAFITVASLFKVSLSKPIELLKSENVGEKPPKANYLFAIVGLLMLGAAYFLAITIEEPMAALVLFFIAVIMVIISTYLLFVSGSVTFCRFLRHCKGYYYRAAHFISASFMAYRMKRVGAGLASICILCTMVMVMMSSTSSLFFGQEDSLRRMYPRDIIALVYDADENGDIKAVAERALNEKKLVAVNSFEYRSASATAMLRGDTLYFAQDRIGDIGIADYEKIRTAIFVSKDEAEKICGKTLSVAQGEALLFCNGANYDGDSIVLDGVGELKIVGKLDSVGAISSDNSGVASSFIFVLENLDAVEKTADALCKVLGEDACKVHTTYGFDLECDDAAQREFVQVMSDEIKATRNGNDEWHTVYVQALAQQREGFYASYGGLFFFAILLAIVFLAAAVLIIYYKQITEGYEDRSRFDILQKVGMTPAQIRKSINSQVLTVFFMPLIVTGMHVAASFLMVSKLLALFGLTNVELQIWVAAICFAVFAVFYTAVYFVTSRAYYSIVSKD